MLRRILIIAWKDTYLRFSDRTQLATNLLTPLLLSTIIGLAFGGASGGELTFENIPVAVVNMDTASETNGQSQNFGQTLVDVLTDAPSEDSDGQGACPLFLSESGDEQGQSLGDLFDTTVLTDVDAARAAVDAGEYAALILIPEDFSAQLAPEISAEDSGIGTPSVEVYANSGFAISANIVRSVVTSIVDQFATSTTAIASTYGALIERASDGNLVVGLALSADQASEQFGPDFACAFGGGANVVSVEQVPLDAVQAQSNFVITLISIGAAQAVFFMLFTGQFGVQDIFYEQRQGTLQRMIVSPTPRWAILVGKLLGVVLSLVVQIALLLTALTLIASLVEGMPLFIWGNNLLLVLIMLAVIVLSVMGISVLLAGVTSTPEQVQVIGPILNASLAALGGAFGFSLPQAVAQFSPVYWAVDGFTKLAGGQNAEAWLNISVLFVQGAIMVLVGLWLFNRRTEI